MKIIKKTAKSIICKIMRLRIACKCTFNINMLKILIHKI